MPQTQHPSQALVPAVSRQSTIQPQAPHAPYDSNFGGRYFEGIDRFDFWSLGSRVVPCSVMHSVIAADLAGRYWWWDTQDDQPNWGLVPEDIECIKIYNEFSQWRSVAPTAIEKWNSAFETATPHSDTAVFDDFFDLQDPFDKLWWQDTLNYLGRAWLYYSLSLAGRWAILEYNPPAFCEFTLGLLLHSSWGSPLPDFVLSQLRANPLTASIPSLFEDLPAEEGGAKHLRLIQGGRRSD